MTDGGVWKKATKEKAGMRWDREVKNIRYNIRGKQDEIAVFIGDCGAYKTKVGGKIRTREKEALRRNVDHEEYVKIKGWSRQGIGMKICLHAQMDREKAETGNTGGRPGAAKRKKGVNQ